MAPASSTPPAPAQKHRTPAARPHAAASACRSHGSGSSRARSARARLRDGNARATRPESVFVRPDLKPGIPPPRLARLGIGIGKPGNFHAAREDTRPTVEPSRARPAHPRVGETPIEPLGVSPLPGFGYCTPYPTAGLPFSCSLPADHSNPRVSRSSTAGSCSV